MTTIPVSWNATDADPVDPRCAHELFADQAARTPEAPAVIAHDGALTYAELDQHANSLAHTLQARGVDQGSVVGVSLPRSVDLVVAVLGSWKAGAVFLPLDPAFPPDRLAFMLADSGAVLVLTHAEERTAESTEEFVGQAQVLSLDTDWDRGRTEVPPEVTVDADGLAYVPYTSGSTGQPKGVLLQHRNLAAYADAAHRTFDLGPGERMLQCCPVSYDGFMWEFTTALFSGAAMCLPAPGIPLVGPELSEFLRQQKITIGVFGPSVLLQQPVADFPDLTTILVAGEPCPEQVVTRWAPGRRLVNGYGLAETTMMATAAECQAGSGPPPIGRPLPHVRLYILDEAGEPVPVGVPGEIYVGGAGVALGYLNRPELTRTRFLGDPFAPEPGSRMYRTGDAGQWRPDGSVDCLGRLDHQITLHGLRIEPGAVEAALRTHDQVRACVVVAREDTPGTKRLIAYFVPETPTPPDREELRRHLRRTLPDEEIPAGFVPLTELPLTRHGKVDRTELPAPEQAAGPRRAQADIRAVLRQIWCEVLGIEQVGLDDAFFDIGGDSLLLIRVRAQIRNLLRVDVSITTLLEFATVRQIAEHIESAPSQPAAAVADSPELAADGVAIIGMAGRFPGASTVDELWELLRNGEEAITRAPSSATTRPDESTTSRTIAAAGVLCGDLEFDAEFFGYSPADAKFLDPQQRLFLETAWEALEHAGHDPHRYPGRIGVFGGCGVPYYWLERVASRDKRPAAAAEQRAMAGNPLQFLTTTVAHKLGLTGPALTVQTACSTSLVAVHLACRSLVDGQCEMAMAGGVHLLPHDDPTYVHEDGGPASADGYCRPFDAQATGAVPGSGVALVVLKRLSQALADGDTIHAVIRGSAVNNDGARKVGFSAPSVDGQREAIVQAAKTAGITMDTVGYVQAHGTATALGDPMEVRALTRAFRQDTTDTGFCALGSVKSSVGHLDAAAGVTGLITAVLALRHTTIPPTLHFQQPNPALELDTSPFYVNPTAVPWDPPQGVPRRAGVSSFGIGGTNAHVIIEEAPPPPTTPAPDEQVLITSARNASALDTANARLNGYLRDHPEVALADVAHTLQQGRTALSHRHALVCAEHTAAVAGRGAVSGVVGADTPEVAFLFPGMGTPRLGMGKQLYLTEPVYRNTFDRCAALFDTALECDIRTMLFADDLEPGAAEQSLTRPSLHTAALFATEYALAQLLWSGGIRPAVLLGHSLGEYTAACVAGMLSLEDTVALVVVRGQLLDALPPAAMMTITLPEQDVVPRLGSQLSLAAVNSASHCLVSGPVEAITELETALAREQIMSRRLPVATASHSALVEPRMNDLAGVRVQRHAPQIPVISGVTGTWITDSEAHDPDHWVRHLRRTVRFADGLDTLLRSPARAIVEVGPGSGLSNLTRAHPAVGENRVICAAMSQPDGGVTDRHVALSAVAELWCHGVEVDWTALHHDERRGRIPLPTYPFQRSTYALGTTTPPPTQTPATAPAVATGDVGEVLTDIWCDVLGVDTVSPHDDFFKSGGNSLIAVQLCGRIEQSLHVTTEVHVLLKHTTFGALLEQVRQLGGFTTPPKTTEPGSLLVTLRTGAPHRTPLFLVQPLGGTVFSYRGLAEHLGPDQGLHGFRASGLESGEPAYRDMKELAARNVEELRAFHPDGPYLLGGHSSGGVIAQEMACQLQDLGCDVPLVVMLDTVPVEESRAMNVHTVPDVIRIFGSFRESAPHVWQAFRTALDTDAGVRDVVVATNEAIRNHEPTPCTSDLLFLRAQEPSPMISPRPERGWIELFDGTVTVHTVPGNHMTIVDDPHVATLARVLGRYLDPADSRDIAESAGNQGLSAVSPSGLRIEGLTIDNAARLLRLVDNTLS